MLRIMFLSLGILLSIGVFAQSEVDALVSQGIKLHDQGDYKGAIRIYKRALKMDPNSANANYEIAFSYSALGDHKTAITYGKKVLKINTKNVLEAYIILGSSYDDMGNPGAAIKTYKKGIKKEGDYYLLHYNLGLTYYRERQLDNAYESLVAAVVAKQDHASSHLLLGFATNEKGKRIQSLLALHRFLMLEPSSKRSEMAYEALMEQQSLGVSANEAGDQIQISISSLDTKDEFRMLEMTMGLMMALNINDEDGVELSKQEQFVKNTTTLFTTLGDNNKDGKYKGIWWDYYVPLFYRLAQSEHMHAYCAYITSGWDKKSKSWVDTHKSEVEDMLDFLGLESGL